MRTEEKSPNYKLVDPAALVRASLGEITLPKIDQGGPRGSGQFVYVDISSIDNKLKRITDQKILEVSTAPSRAKQRLKAGDVLVSMTRPNLNAVAILPQELDGAIGSTGFHVLRSSEEVEPRWLYYAVQTHRFTSKMSELVQGALYPAVRPKDIRAFQITVPPLEQQNRIIAEIEKQFSRLDEAVASLKRAKANLKRYKAAVLKAAVEGKLTEEWRKAHPDVEPASKLLQRILGERRRKWEEAELAKMKGKGKVPKDKKWKAKYKEPAAPDSTGLPELPKNWAWAGWEQIGFSQNGRPFPSGEYCDKGVKLLRPGNLHESGTLVWTSENTRHMPARYAEESSDLILRGGEIVMNLTAQSLKDEFLGRVCLTPAGEYCLLNQRLARLTPLVPPAFALVVFKSKLFRRFVDGLNTGSLIQHMFVSQLATFAFPLPPIPEQKIILEKVERRTSLIREVEKQLHTNLQRTERLRQSILKKAFSGQLVPQNPEDEPASLLLDKIREKVLPKSEKRAHKAVPPVTKTTLRNGAKATLPISPAADSILNHMQPNREYSRAEIMDALGLSVSQWGMAVRELKEGGRIHQSGERRGARYSKISITYSNQN